MGNETDRSAPTPYPEVNRSLQGFLQQSKSILGDDFVGMYLYGSLALGDFNPETSDIDFLVVTGEELPGETVEALAIMHQELIAAEAIWGARIEGSYIPQQALRRYTPGNTRHPHLDKGERLVVDQHDEDWIIQRWVVREHGVVVAGPEPKSLIDPISKDDLTQAIAAIVRGWWEPMLADPTLLLRPGYQGYTVLTMCRCLYTLRTGSVVSKIEAARWAQQNLDKKWQPVINQALQSRYDQKFSDLEATQSFIRLTLQATPDIFTPPPHHRYTA